MNLYFNKTCQRYKIIPKYINVKISNQSRPAQIAKQKAEKSWLTNAIKLLYTKINRISIDVYNLQLKISKSFHQLEYEAIIKSTEIKVKKVIIKKQKVIKRKINTLKIQKKSQMDKCHSESENCDKLPTFNKRVENHTTIQFNSKELSLLEKGLKHSIHPTNKISEQNKHLLNIENTILKVKPNEQQEIRAILINEITKNSEQNYNSLQKIPNNNKETTKVISEIKKKLKENSAIITKADKGNTLVIMESQEYNNKINEYIINNKIEKIQNDPTNEYNTTIKQIINKSSSILSDKVMRYNKMIKPSAPNIRGLPKIHKEGIPIRPLINFTTAPTYRISKHVNNLLKQYIKLDNSHSLKNNIQLINKIRSIEIPRNAKLASFDITNMYTNIPINETIAITKNLLIKHGIKTADTEEIVNIITEITKQNYFKHNKEFYKQTEGLPMGSPLSGTLAEIYLNNFENQHVHNRNNIYRDNIIYWYRYVDDIILLFKGTIRQLDKLHQYLNNRQPTIKFTLEIEKENSINFLDLTIKNSNSKHTFKIYRKPTQTDQTINIQSHHPFKHRISSYIHMINRLNSIPMSKTDYQEELNIIKYIARKNGYNSSLIDQINKRNRARNQIQTQTTLQKDDKKDKKYISVEYNKMTHKIIQKTLNKFGYTTAYKNNNKLEQKLRNKDNTEEIDTGVYKLTCDECPKYYIGQTGRKFETRYKEHINDIKKKETKSNYALHLKTENHKYTDFNTNLTILHRVRKGQKLDRLEELEIYKQKNNSNLLNDKINTKTNKIYDLIIKNNKKGGA